MKSLNFVVNFWGKNPTLCCLSDVRVLDEREEPGFLTGLKIPAPWAAGKTVETVHPVRDNYKFKETVHIPGARCLYLRFDSRCSSQYDYDKVFLANTCVVRTSSILTGSLKILSDISAGYLCRPQHQQPESDRVRREHSGVWQPQRFRDGLA